MRRRTGIAFAGVLLASSGLCQDASAKEKPYPMYEGMVLEELYLQTQYGYEMNIDLCFPAEAGATERAPGRFDGVLDYNYTSSAGEISCDGMYREFVRHGYVVGIVQTRGTGETAGGFADLGDTTTNQAMADATDWMAGQDWSTGKFGAIGGSGNGSNLLGTAAMKPEALKAIIPFFTTNNGYESFFPGGMQATWLPAVGCAATNVSTDVNNGLYTPPRDQADVERSVQIRRDQVEWFQEHPGSPPPCLLFEDYNNHPSYDEWWEEDRIKLENLDIPVWVMGSWDDLTNSLTTEIYTGWGPYKKPGNPNNQLSMGFVSHTGNSPGFDMAAEAIRFFDYHLRGIKNGIREEAADGAFRYMNMMEWTPRVAPDYPIPGTQWTSAYLNTESPDPLAAGSLTFEPPSDVLEATYPYLPDDGSRGFTSGLARARNERQPEQRDILAYNDPLAKGDQRYEPAVSRVAFLSEPLTQDMTLTGRPTMTLYASTTATDTDFVVRLIDVVPHGELSASEPQPGMWRVISPARLKGTFRSYLSEDLSSYTQPTPIPAGEVVKYELAFDPTGWLLKKGHRLGAIVMSSDVPHTYPNPNPAVVTVHSSAEYPSHVNLPVIPAGASSLDANSDGIADESRRGSTATAHSAAVAASTTDEASPQVAEGVLLAPAPASTSHPAGKNESWAPSVAVLSITMLVAAHTRRWASRRGRVPHSTVIR